MLCTFILPWVLGLLGHRINAARVRLRARRVETRESLCAASERWVRWGSVITRRPWTALLVAGIPLLILAFQARRIAPGVPDHDSLPAAAESVQALHTLQGMGRSGIVQSLRVVLELPPQSPPLSPAGWLAVSRLTKRFRAILERKRSCPFDSHGNVRHCGCSPRCARANPQRVFFAAMARLP